MMLLEGTALKYYVKEKLLFNIDLLQVHAKQCIGLVGRNGCGKSTLLKIIAGELLPDEGRVHLFSSIKLVPQIKKTDMRKSGGEITQTYLQRAIHANPGILILDEPTTHLDTERIKWLEKKLKSYEGTLILVSHDRTFLDQLCTEIWAMENASLTEYKGNYSDYSQQKALERKTQLVAVEKYEKEKQKLEKAIREKEEKAQRATKKPKHVSSTEARKTKMYYAGKQKKLRKTVKALESRLDQLEQVDKPKDLPAIKMNVVNEEHIKNQVIVRAEQLPGQVSGHVDSHQLWKPFNLFVRSGDKMAIIGPNGAGKTTLLRKLVDRAEGIWISPAVKVGYFSQHLTIIDEEQTILQNVQSVSQQNETLIRTVLARMHFWEDDVYKKVAVLSGGEKVKVALTKLFLSDVNMLVLDEPTNFLDIESLEAFETLMTSYSGTVLFVTHDRQLVRNLATKILEINNQEVTVFDGTYEAFEERAKHRDKETNENELLIIENQISDVLGRLSLEPSEQLDAEFQRLLIEKKKLIDNY